MNIDHLRMEVVEICGLSRGAGGLFYAVTSLCKELDIAGVRLRVFGKEDPFIEQDRSGWAEISTISYRGHGPLKFSLRLRRMLGEGAPDLVHQHGLWLDDQWASLQWQKKTGHPVVISPHGMLDLWALRNSAWKKKLAGKLFANESLREATCIHALCRSEADSIRAYGLKNPIAIIPNGVELPSLQTSNSKPQTQRKQLLFLGRIHPKKGLSELLRGWAKAKSQKPKAFSNWQLIIAGWDDGNHLEELKQLVSQLGLSWSDEAPPSDLRPSVFAKSTSGKPSASLCSPTSDLCFIGPQFGAEKDALLRSVDAFILPSFSEGLPMSVLEAWSYDLPVVITDFCNLPEGFAADAGIRVEPNPDSIMQGIEKLTALPDSERVAMGARGRKLIEEKFTWPKIAGEMTQVYEWCLTGGTPPDCVEF